MGGTVGLIGELTKDQFTENYTKTGDNVDWQIHSSLCKHIIQIVSTATLTISIHLKYPTQNPFLINYIMNYLWLRIYVLATVLTVLIIRGGGGDRK